MQTRNILAGNENLLFRDIKSFSSGLLPIKPKFVCNSPFLLAEPKYKTLNYNLEKITSTYVHYV